MKTVAAIHTAAPMVEPTKKLFTEHLPDVRLFNIADDSLIQDVIRDERVTSKTARRLMGYYFAAIIAGDAAQHDALILDTAQRVADRVDLIVLAQGSMARMEETLATATGKPVLSSPVSGVLAVKERLAQLA
ncbi:hypothetical protein ACFL6U_10580 [Planctomycetota bacterium]